MTRKKHDCVSTETETGKQAKLVIRRLPVHGKTVIAYSDFTAHLDPLSLSPNTFCENNWPVREQSHCVTVMRHGVCGKLVTISEANEQKTNKLWLEFFSCLRLFTDLFLMIFQKPYQELETNRVLLWASLPGKLEAAWRFRYTFTVLLVNDSSIVGQ